MGKGKCGCLDGERKIWGLGGVRGEMGVVEVYLVGRV